MRQIRIYHNGELQNHGSITLSPEASHHILKVLKCPLGTSLTLFNGNNHEYSATLIGSQKKLAEVTINEVLSCSRESSLSIHLAQGISKGDKMEWVIQKAIELGVTEITPIISQHMAYQYTQEKYEKKQRQWELTAIGAAEQCGRNTLATIHPPTPFRAFVDKHSHNLWLLSPHAKPLSLSEKTMSKITLCIGPEGGFSDEEITYATEKNAKALSLGTRILRTETAAIAAIAIIQAQFGDLNFF